MMARNGRAEATLVKANYFLEQLMRAIGKRPLAQIEPFEVLVPLKRLEAAGKHETAKNAGRLPAGCSATVSPRPVARAI